MKEKPRPGSEEARKVKDDRKLCWAATVISILIFVVCYTDFFPSFLYDYHVAALARGGWNDVASIAGIIFFAIGPVAVWLGASDFFPAAIGEWIPVPGAIWLISLIGGIALSAGFVF